MKDFKIFRTCAFKNTDEFGKRKSVVDGFEWLWMGSLRKNIQLMLVFLKTPFLVLHFSYYTSVTFLMMLSVLLLYMLMMILLLSTLSVIRHQDLWQQLDLASELESETPQTGAGSDAC